MEISSAGFQFLLLDTASQVWFFILKYLENVNMRGLSLVPCLNFLFKLSFCTLGKVSYLLCISIIVFMLINSIISLLLIKMKFN